MVTTTDKYFASVFQTVIPTVMSFALGISKMKDSVAEFNENKGKSTPIGK